MGLYIINIINILIVILYNIIIYLALKALFKKDFFIIYNIYILFICNNKFFRNNKIYYLLIIKYNY
jgi:hypothetical protein